MGLGGGGHPRAAGATIKQPLQKAMALVIAEVEREVQETDRLTLNSLDS
jgi:bifunctional oligoribonuclease and PAP phosphatase NrnA